jgi:hypothetical protein
MVVWSWQTVDLHRPTSSSHYVPFPPKSGWSPTWQRSSNFLKFEFVESDQSDLRKTTIWQHPRSVKLIISHIQQNIPVLWDKMPIVSPKLMVWSQNNPINVPWHWTICPLCSIFDFKKSINSKKNVPKENYPTKSDLKLNSRLIISNQFPQTRHTQRFLASFFDIVQDLFPEVLVRWIRWTASCSMPIVIYTQLKIEYCLI